MSSSSVLAGRADPFYIVGRLAGARVVRLGIPGRTPLRASPLLSHVDFSAHLRAGSLDPVSGLHTTIFRHGAWLFLLLQLLLQPG
jgi:hypothetical protein